MEDDSSAMDVGCGGPFSMMLCGSDDQENDGMFGGILAAFGLGGGASSTTAPSKSFSAARSARRARDSLRRSENIVGEKAPYERTRRGRGF